METVTNNQRPQYVEVAEYSTRTFDFRGWFSKVFGTDDLESLHRLRNVTPENYQAKFQEARALCEGRIGEIGEQLDAFFREVVTPTYGRILSRQQVATVRAHFAVTDPLLEAEHKDLLSLGASAFLQKHYFDSYRPAMFHRDKDYGLPSGTVNLWLPVTDVQDVNSIWIGGPDLRGRDAVPIALRHGQCMFFDGANRWHGTVWNTSPTTRVSFDIRFLPEEAARSVSRP